MKAIDFPIIDSHIHQWDPYKTPHAAGPLVKIFGRYPKLMDKIVRAIKPKQLLDTLGLTDYSLSPYLPADFIEDCCDWSIDSVVHVEASWHEHQSFGTVNETKWISTLPFSNESVRLGAIVGAADPRNHNFEKVLEAHTNASPLFRGIRKMASYHQDDGVYKWCDKPGLYRDSSFLRGFESISRMDLTFDAWVYSEQLNDVTSLAKAFPNTQIAIDHLGTPVGIFGSVGFNTGINAIAREDIFRKWKDDISLLAECQNVHAKISGLMMPVLGHSYYRTRELASTQDMISALSPLISHALEVFGPKRIMFASNFPMDKVNARLSDIIETYVEIIAPYGREALKGIFRENASHFYSIAEDCREA